MGGFNQEQNRHHMADPDKSSQPKAGEAYNAAQPDQSAQLVQSTQKTQLAQTAESDMTTQSAQLDQSAENKPAKSICPVKTIGLVGLGLIGGSLARAIRQYTDCIIIALDRDPSAISQAMADLVINQGAVISQQPEDIVQSPFADKMAWSLLEPCEIVFICTPVDLVPIFAKQASLFTDAMITDVASVKKPVMDNIELDRFVGGHPMAGSEKHGYRHASESLFENAIYVLCVPESSKLAFSEIKQLETLILTIRATPLHMAPDAHDFAVAAVSHLPHVVASGLALLASRNDKGDLARLAAGGFRDITRIASADAQLWADISSHSARELAPLIDQMIQILTEFRQALDQEHQKSLEQYFFQAAQYRQSLPTDGRGALAAQSMLTVYINDKPGELGRVTTLLGKEGVNISNIRIREFRAYEGGCLQLLIKDSLQASRAAWMLKEAGYVCD